eukprot:3912536-Pyramimonas_sp.AAC.1
MIAKPRAAAGASSACAGSAPASGCNGSATSAARRPRASSAARRRSSTRARRKAQNCLSWPLLFSLGGRERGLHAGVPGSSRDPTSSQSRQPACVQHALHL